MDAQQQQSNQRVLRFVFAGLSGICATLIVHPFDVIKNRLQLNGELGQSLRHSSMRNAAKNLLNEDGVRSFYKGLSAGILRQATYGTCRLGLYSWIMESLSADKPVSAVQKFSSGLFAGGVASIISLPSEVVLIRMMADGQMAPSQKRNYKNVLDGLVRICREEGVMTLSRGMSPTVVRAMIINSIQLGSYSQIKEFLKMKLLCNENILIHILASTASGLLTAFFSLPFDIAKTRYQNMNTKNVPQYKNIVDVFVKTIRYEGFTSLWKGFNAYFLRICPHTVLTLVFFEQINHLYQRVAYGAKHLSSSL